MVGEDRLDAVGDEDDESDTEDTDVPARARSPAAAARYAWWLTCDRGL